MKYDLKLEFVGLSPITMLICIDLLGSGYNQYYRMYSITKLNVEYNEIMRLFLRLPRHHSASQLFANVNVQGFYAVIRNLKFNNQT